MRKKLLKTLLEILIFWRRKLRMINLIIWMKLRRMRINIPSTVKTSLIIAYQKSTMKKLISTQSLALLKISSTLILKKRNGKKTQYTIFQSPFPSPSFQKIKSKTLQVISSISSYLHPQNKRSQYILQEKTTQTGFIKKSGKFQILEICWQFAMTKSKFKLVL